MYFIARLLRSTYSRRAQRKSTAGAKFLLQLPQPSCEEPALRLGPNQGQRPLIRLARLHKPSQLAAQVSPGGVREVVAGELIAGQQGVDETKTLFRPIAHRDGHCAVEFHDR